MKTSGQFDTLLQDLWKRLERSEPAVKDPSLVMAVRHLVDVRDELSGDAEKTRRLLAFARALRTASLPGRQRAEEKLMETLAWLACVCCGPVAENAMTQLAGFEVDGGADPAFAQTVEVLRELHDYAIDCLGFKRPRDSFGGQRRALAFEILGGISGVVNLPEVVLRARKQLQDVNATEARAAADFLLEYFAVRELPMDEEITGELLSMVERTDSHSNAFGALNALVETGTVSEWKALDRMDAWKDRHE